MGLAHSPSIVTDGLLLYLDAANAKSYPGSGAVFNDLSGNNQTGTLQNGPTFNNSKLGSLLCDGTDDFISFPTTYALSNSTGWSLSCWFAPHFSGINVGRISGTFGTTGSSYTISSFFHGFVQARPIYVEGTSFVYAIGRYISKANPQNRELIKFNYNGSVVETFQAGIGIKQSGISFNSGFKSSYVPNSIYLLSAGSWSRFGRQGLYRVNINTGEIDTSFISVQGIPAYRSSGCGFDNGVNSVAEDSVTGKLYVGGQFRHFNDVSSNFICSLNPDGTINSAFNAGTGFNSVVFSIAINSNNKIYVAGNFTSYNGTSINRIVRLNTDGTIDTAFNVGTGFNSNVLNLTLDSNGKLYAVGTFTSYNGTSINRIVRLNTDGTIDTAFNVGTGFNSTVNETAINSDGKIYVAGNFTSYNGTSINRIVRLNTDGTIDTAFNVGTGFNSNVTIIKLDSSGKLYAGFTNNDPISYNSQPISCLVRLNTDGSLDLDFFPSSNFDTHMPVNIGLATAGSPPVFLNPPLASTGFPDIDKFTDLVSTYSGNTPLNLTYTMSSDRAYRVYVNGQLNLEISNIDLTTYPRIDVSRVMFGSAFVKGSLYSAAIYSRGLSTAEVAQNYAATRGRFGL
jgi:uncharacterized delta-60 repeat protein